MMLKKSIKRKYPTGFFSVKIPFVLLLLTFSINLGGQQVMDFEKFMSMVLEQHPISYQAKLLDDAVIGRRLMARGGFDPKLETEYSRKLYDDKNYYTLLGAGVKIPTWYGVELKAGYDYAAGDFLDLSESIPRRGLWNAGISVPLGKGLIIDERRAALKQADIFEQATEQEQLLLINELLYNAALSYLRWQIAEQNFIIALDGREIAAERFIATRSSFVNGDKPAIDTLEALITIQDRDLDVFKADQERINARLAINNFMWLEGEIPLELEDQTDAETLQLGQFQILIETLSLTEDQWIANHAELLLYNYKLASLDLDRRLAVEDLKPDLRINYNPLVGVGETRVFDQFQSDNFKLGASLSYPLLLRKERGKLKLVDVKRQEATFDRTMKLQDINVKINVYRNQIAQSMDQYDLLQSTLTNYDELRKAEYRKFEVGESSVFLVNSREQKYLEVRYKLNEAAQKLIKNRLGYLFTSVKMVDAI